MGPYSGRGICGSSAPSSDESKPRLPVVDEVRTRPRVGKHADHPGHPVLCRGDANGMDDEGLRDGSDAPPLRLAGGDIS